MRLSLTSSLLFVQVAHCILGVVISLGVRIITGVA